MARKIKALGLMLVAVIAMSVVGASAASAADFKASSYPEHLIAKGEGTATFSINGLNTTCIEAGGVPPVELTGFIQQQTGSVDLGAPVGKSGTEVWRNCHATVLKIPTTIHQNGCKFRLTAGLTKEEKAGTSTGSADIVGCEDPAKGLTVTIGTEGKTCHVDVPEQNPSEGSVTYHTETTEGGKEDVTATAGSVVFEVDSTGGTACAGSTSEPVAQSATLNLNTRTSATEGVSFTVVDT